MTMTRSVPCGKPDAGKPHVRFDEGEVASAKPRRVSLLYKKDGNSSIYRFVDSSIGGMTCGRGDRATMLAGCRGGRATQRCKGAEFHQSIKHNRARYGDVTGLEKGERS